MIRSPSPTKGQAGVTSWFALDLGGDSDLEYQPEQAKNRNFVRFFVCPILFSIMNIDLDNEAKMEKQENRRVDVRIFKIYLGLVKNIRNGKAMFPMARSRRGDSPSTRVPFSGAAQ